MATTVATDQTPAACPDGNELLVACYMKKQIQRIEPGSGKVIGSSMKLLFTPNRIEIGTNSLLAVANANAMEVELYDFKSQTMLHRLRQSGRAGRLAFTPDGNFLIATNGKSLVTNEYEKHLCLWDTRTGIRIGPKLLQACESNACAVTSDGKWIVGGDSSGAVMVWETPQPMKGTIQEIKEKVHKFMEEG